MPRRSSPSSKSPPTLETIAAQALQLSKADRMELIALLQAYNEAAAETVQSDLDREDRKQKALNRQGVRGGRGSLEDKYINGYGPYRYFRYWYGRTHKSVYLGKVKEN